MPTIRSEPSIHEGHILGSHRTKNRAALEVGGFKTSDIEDGFLPLVRRTQDLVIAVAYELTVIDLRPGPSLFSIHWEPGL